MHLQAMVYNSAALLGFPPTKLPSYSLGLTTHFLLGLNTLFDFCSRLLIIDLDADINDGFAFTPAEVDRITLSFPGKTWWKDYVVDHIVIEQVTFIAT